MGESVLGFRRGSRHASGPAADRATDHEATDHERTGHEGTGHEGTDHSSAHSVTLVTRARCHLCEGAEQTLRRLAGELGFGYTEVDVDADPGRRAEYSDRVPVILIDGREHGYWRVEEARFRAALRKPVRP